MNLLYGRRRSVLAESWSRLGRMCTWGSSVGQDRVPNHGHGKEENKKGVGAGKMDSHNPRSEIHLKKTERNKMVSFFRSSLGCPPFLTYLYLILFYSPTFPCGQSGV